MNKLEAIGIKEKDKPFRVQHSAMFKVECDKLDNGKYLLSVKKYRRKASPSQFGYLFGLVYPQFLIALNNAGYEFTDVSEVDNFAKTLWANKEVVNRETGEIVKIPISKKEFLTVDHMVFTAKIREYSSEYLHHFISDPDPNWKTNKES